MSSLLERGLGVVDRVASARRPVSFSALLEATGINRSTLSKILKILLGRHYLEKRAGGYVLGPAPAALARPGRLTLCARPQLEALSAEHQVAAMLLRASETGDLVLEKAVHPQAPQMRPVGAGSPPLWLHPWFQLDDVRHGRATPEQIGDWLRREAGTAMAYASQPTDAEVRATVAALAEGYGDDQAAVIRPTRRIAAPLASAPRHYLALGIARGECPDHRVPALLAALRRAAGTIDELFTA